MKTIMKIIFVWVALFHLLPNRVEAKIADGICGEKLTWELSEEGVLTISGSGSMDNFEYILHYNGNIITIPWADYLEKINRVKIDTGITSIGEYAFAGCSNLAHIDIPETVISIGDFAFQYCDSLEKVELPMGIKKLGMIFSFCRGIKEVTIPETDTEIADYAFKNCVNLQKINMPTSITNIGRDAFYGCVSLKEFVIPEGITEIKTATFAYCSNLYKIVIPKSVSSIGNYAFTHCNNLTDVYYGDTKEVWEKIVIGSDNDGLEQAIIHDSTTEPITALFSDVVENSYYEEAVYWAVENKITNGTSDTTFNPYDTCTRAQMVTFLWRAAGSPEPETSICPFQDVAKDVYYYKAVLWAVENNITCGITDTTFAPDNVATRAQNVTFLWRVNNSPVEEQKNPFTDISEEDYYYDSVLWAAANGITNGTSDTTFAPNDSCQRCQCVTFLYRLYEK